MRAKTADMDPGDPLDKACRALVAAEEGDAGAMKLMDDTAVKMLSMQAASLAGIVPVALARLYAQLAGHRKATVRIEAVRVMRLVVSEAPEEARATLAKLVEDDSKTVREAAKVALAEIEASPPRRMARASSEMPSLTPLDQGWEWS